MSDKWEQLKQWLEEGIEAETQLADITKAENYFAYNEALGHLEGMRSVLNHMNLMELKAI